MPNLQRRRSLKIASHNICSYPRLHAYLHNIIENVEIMRVYTLPNYRVLQLFNEINICMK